MVVDGYSMVVGHTQRNAIVKRVDKKGVLRSVDKSVELSTTTWKKWNETQMNQLQSREIYLTEVRQIWDVLR